ncbi:MAG: hypothetical protein CL868_15740 [Cytophagaceae bacterium]|nr:hypothetical protein [Cytophagaceae bacterium]
MHKISCFILGFLIVYNLNAQGESIAEQLGYPKDSKLLIVHADDLGVSHSENVASFDALEHGSVTSASIMVPTPWFTEVVKYAKTNNSNLDFGLHLTITSEWENYKWGPVSSKDSVTGLLNKNGYFYSAVDSVVQNASAKEVEIEINNQIKTAYKAGIDVTHLDAHMGGVMNTPAYLEAYIKAGRANNVPVLLTKQIPFLNEVLDKMQPSKKDVVVENLYSAGPTDFDNGMADFYTDLMGKIAPGLSCLIIHVAQDNDEMQAVTVDHPYWGSAWRQADYDFFTSEKCKTLLEENNIKLITWKEVRDKIVRAE